MVGEMPERVDMQDAKDGDEYTHYGQAKREVAIDTGMVPAALLTADCFICNDNIIMLK
jgi:hypothetical protein